MIQAQNFTLKNQEGKEISLSDYKGKWVILYFYPKDDTPGCTAEACDFTMLRKDHPNLVIIGISPDTVESHVAFIKKHNLGLILLSDPEKEVLKAYDAWGMKKNYGKAYEGVIRSTFLISPEGEIARTWKNVTVAGHAEQVFKHLAKSHPSQY